MIKIMLQYLLHNLRVIVIWDTTYTSGVEASFFGYDGLD